MVRGASSPWSLVGRRTDDRPKHATPKTAPRSLARCDGWRRCCAVRAQPAVHLGPDRQPSWRSWRSSNSIDATLFGGGTPPALIERVGHQNCACRPALTASTAASQSCYCAGSFVSPLAQSVRSVQSNGLAKSSSLLLPPRFQNSARKSLIASNASCSLNMTQVNRPLRLSQGANSDRQRASHSDYRSATVALLRERPAISSGSGRSC